MYKKLAAIIFSLFFGVVALAQLKSPSEFLGYELGTRYTPHYKIVAYLQHVAAASNMVQLKEYGTTNEQRPLMVAFVSTDTHINNLPTIQQHNLSVVSGKSVFDANQPALVWLSYNVHGNEPTSSEAAMETLYELVNPLNTQTKEWLKNTVVVIDPCLNPDGRDRYVNWFNGIVGKHYNANPLSREHKEPWPQGRSNHYNFDLNRDWAWQTQIESRQRMALYNSWLPQVHVDFHEQSYNSPYYFAPAAEPFHDVLTKWQRDFQVTIGKKLASSFDKNNWLYFTKERFDLFYPSYGDTYPLYNGAIGMTYEQGGIGGGLGVITRDEDTLTLVERVKHHVVTSLNTIEVSSQQASQLLSEFQKYFVAANTGNMDSYKSYIIKYADEDAARLEALKSLLQKNNIHFGTSSGAGIGFNYFSKKNENFTIGNKDIVIPGNQPKAALVRVLFEPESRLSDSITYDITAWAMPYVYGLKAFATKATFKITTSTPTIISNKLNDAYGYVFPWTGAASAKVLSALLQKGFKLRISEKPFNANGKTYNAGSVIVLKNGNQKMQHSLLNELKTVADANAITVDALSSGLVDAGLDFGSENVLALKTPKVVLLSGPFVNAYSAGEVWNLFDNILQYPISIVNVENLSKLNWSNTDVLIMPTGNYPFLSNKSTTDVLQNWIKNGGKLITIESATEQVAKQEWSVLKSKTLGINMADTAKVSPSKYDERERNDISKTTPGAIFKVDIDNTHPLMFGYPNFYFTLKQDTILYNPIVDKGWNVGVLKDDKQVAGFVGNQLAKKLKNGVLFAVQDMGKGHIIYFTDNVLFRNFWENGILMFANAVFFVGNN